jgi:hypothetical protein
MSFSQKLTTLIQELRAISADSLRLPLPRRAELEPVLEYRKLLLGSDWNMIIDLCKKEISAVEIMNILVNNPAHMESMAKKGIHPATINSNLFIMRHLATEAPIMSVSEGLKQMLIDTKIKDEVPAKFFAPPFKSVYIEFDAAANRHMSKNLVTLGGVSVLCEGCYVQESRYEKPLKMSRAATDSLEIDPNKPVRIIEIGFTASPFNSLKSVEDTMGMPVASDSIDFCSIYIQDEDESINDVLDRHFNHFRNTVLLEQKLSENDRRHFESLFKENFSTLAKILFYLHLEKREQVTVNEASLLEERLKGIGEKKQDKLKRQLQRKYDHIVIGPSHYTPIAERIATGTYPPGTKAPHYRRGTFAIRWTGTKQARVPVLTRIKESIINKDRLTSTDTPPVHKDYTIH